MRRNRLETFWQVLAPMCFASVTIASASGQPPPAPIWLEFIELRQTSRTQILDAAALSAVKAAQLFPPVPDAVAKRTLFIDWTFRYQNNSGAQNVPFWEMPLPGDAVPQMQKRRAPE
jgi:hypothetical protein